MDFHQRIVPAIMLLREAQNHPQNHEDVFNGFGAHAFLELEVHQVLDIGLLNRSHIAEGGDEMRFKMNAVNGKGRALDKRFFFFLPLLGNLPEVDSVFHVKYF